jgi:type II secretory pathway pseudopilin PulG
MKPRAGYTLIEAVAALCIGCTLLAAAAAALALQLRVANDAHIASRAAEAERTAFVVIGEETRYLVPGVDLRVLAEDSLSLRVFRGVAVPCEGAGIYTYRGLRLPSAEKDSAVGVLTGSVGAVGGVATAVSTNGCGSGRDAVVDLTLATDWQPAEPVLVFESGTYYISGGALRYRLGAEGRQPLTEEWLDGRSRFAIAQDSSALWLYLVAAALAGPRSDRPDLVFRYTFVNHVVR